MNDAANKSPIACDLTALDPEQRERHQRHTQQLFASVQDIQELPNGYAFRLPTEAGTILRAAEFISLERLCCPFFNFVLEVEPERGPLWLKMTGQDGVKQFLQAEFNVKGEV